MNSAFRSPSRTVLYWSIFGLGLALSIVMALRSQVEADQVNQLRFGWWWIAQDVFLPHGMPTSAGGFSPGSLITLFSAVPLMIWWDFRALALSMVVINMAAFLFLERSIRPALGSRGRWLLLLLLWLGPWRMAFSSFIWPPNYALPMGLLHLATAVHMRQKPVALATFAHVLLIGLGAQLHSSAALLALLSIALFTTRLIKVHWSAFAAATCVTLLSLIPWIRAIATDPSLAPAGAGFPFRGLTLIYPMVRGLGYTLRMASLSLPSRLTTFDFTPAFGVGTDHWLLPPMTLLAAVAHLTALVPIWAVARLFRKARRRRPWSQEADGPLRGWLKGYLAMACCAAALSFAASPTTMMYWQTQVLMATITLVVVIPLEGILRTRHRPTLLRCLSIWTVVTVLLLATITAAAPMFRQGGRKAAVAVLTADEPLIDELGLRNHCTVTIDENHNWAIPD
ncbi:MAG: hypothetical protein DRJ65_09425 [Acidobacteria bacterium]|nr:MAG: hypothetical protein DRJ65_09425 [Acidobacteriota bacterium]